MSRKYKFADDDKIYFVSFAVIKAEEWKYSSAIDYYGGKGLLEILKLDTLIA